MQFLRLSISCLLILVMVSVAFAEPVIFPEAGAPGSTITISGETFGEFTSSDVNRVFFGTVPALVQRWDSDLIEAKVPFNVSSGPVFVASGKKKTAVGTFTVQYPKITSLQPAEVEAGKVLVLSGKNFGNTAGPKDPNTMFGVNEVIVGGVKARVQKWRNDKIEVRVPATAKTGDVIVQLSTSDPLPNGYCCAPVKYTKSNSLAVTVLPSIQVDPKSGPVGTKVVLFGQEFGNTPQPGDIITLGGKPVTMALWEERNIVFHVPLNATTGPLVLTHKGKKRNLGDFTVVAPVVKKIQPAEGPIGSLLRISGENFGQFTENGPSPFSFIDFDFGENSVTVGGAKAIIYRWDQDHIDVWVPFSAKSGPVVIKRGGSIPKSDGTCCAKKGVITIDAGNFDVVTPKVTSVSPRSAGLDEIVTIKGSGFGTFLKGREATDGILGSNAFLGKLEILGENISRTEVLFNGVGAIVTAWTDSQIKVRVPRRHLYGIGSLNTFNTDLAKGPLLVRRGSWDLKPDGSCCTPKKWITAEAGEFTIQAEGLPDQGWFTDTNDSAQ